MERMVITVIGDDRAGLVEALAEAVASVDANWERSRMAELAGQFAGIVLVTVPAVSVDELRGRLDAIQASGLLHVSIRPAALPADVSATDGIGRWRLRLVAQDHTGIVHRVSRTLAGRAVSIDELETEVVPAPMGGMVFRAEARLEVPDGVDIEVVRDDLEALTPDLMVDLDPDGDGETGATPT
jgi:glycine cleavage system regulatory protein